MDAATEQALLQRAAAGQAAEKAAYEREVAAWRASCRAEIDGLDDPVARLVLVVASFLSTAPRPTSYQGHSYHSQMVAWDRVEFIAPDLVPRSPREPAPWNHDEIQAWFLSAVSAAPEDVFIEQRRGLFGLQKKRLPGWNFDEGSTWRYNGNSPKQSAISVLADGRRVYHWSFKPREPNEGFNANALRQMARLTGLPPLPPEPTARR